MTDKLPEGWTVDEEDGLPPGWSINPSAPTAKARDEQKLHEAAGPYDVAEKTPEELKKMSIQERLEYSQDLNRMREYLQSKQLVSGALSGLTFGATKNVEALKPIELEETSPYSLLETTGEIAGSFLPLSKLINVFSGPALKLAAKSPVLQKQLSSLATMFGVGAAESGLRSVAKGEMPSTDQLLEHGFEWAALDALLQTAGVAGRFAKNLVSRSQATGQSRLEIVNQLTRELADSGLDMTNAEAVSAKALEILQRPLSEAEEAIAATRKLQLAQQEESQAAKIAQEAIQPQEITPKDLKTRKIEDQRVSAITNEVHTLAEPYQPEAIDLRKESETLENDAIQESIDRIGTRAASEEDLGNSIRENIEEQLEARKDEYRPLYKQAEEAAAEQLHIPENTAKVAGDKLLRMGQLSTKPAGYANVLHTLENALEDAGYTIQKNKRGEIQQIISTKEVPVDRTMELARRLNEMVDYEAVEPSVKDALRSVARAAKKDIREGLAANPDALTAFELAEQAHAKTAALFGRDSIRKARGQQAGEKVAKMAEAPTAFGELKEVLSPEQFLQVEREMLEKLNNQSYDKAQKTFRDVQKHISEDTRKLAKEIVEAKNPHNTAVRNKLTQQGILNDISTAFNTGSRPEKTLGLWRTPKGQKLVKETFHNSPNWPAVKGYLEKQSFNDMVSSVLKDGKIDLKKLNTFMRDPATVNNIRAIGGDEAVVFFRDLSSQTKQFEQNAKLLEKFPTRSEAARGKDILKRFKEKAAAKPSVSSIGEKELQRQVSIAKESKGNRGKGILQRMAAKDFPLQARVKKWREWFTETMGLNEKGVLSVFGLMKLGLPNTVVSLITYKLLNKMLTTPSLRKAFSQAAKHQTNPLKFILAVENLAAVMDEEGI